VGVERVFAPAERTDAGYRMFTDHDLGVLRFIRAAKALGLTLAEIKEVLDCNGAAPPRADGSPHCSTRTSPRSTAHSPICADSVAP